MVSIPPTLNTQDTATDGVGLGGESGWNSDIYIEILF
jgi:hypothetical protein